MEPKVGDDKAITNDETSKVRSCSKWSRPQVNARMSTTTREGLTQPDIQTYLLHLVKGLRLFKQHITMNHTLQSSTEASTSARHNSTPVNSWQLRQLPTLETVQLLPLSVTQASETGKVLSPLLLDVLQSRTPQEGAYTSLADV